MNQEKVRKYVDEMIARFQKGGDGLSKEERRLIANHTENLEMMRRYHRDIDQAEQQISQMRARINSMRVSAAMHEGRAGSYLDSLIAREFEDELPPVEMPKKASTVATKGNGKEDPSAGNKKARRTKKAKKKADKQVQNQTQA